MKRIGSAVWNGGIKDGKGTVSTASGVLKQTQYSFLSRFESGAGTNPEELLAAAHAGCFSMALSKQLEDAGMKADSIETTCTITFEPVDGKPTIIESHLNVSCKITNGDQAKFEAATQGAKAGCPVSRLFNTKITMDAKLA
jgi:osmotically inducible protein OsmC